MSIKAWNIFILLSLLAMLGIGGGFLHLNNLKHQAAQKVAEKQAEEQRLANLQAIEDFLNGFLKEVNDAAHEYKQRRVILTNLTKPMNMATPEYVTENASLAESTLMALQLQMDKIMGAFKTADEKFETLVTVLKEDDQPAVRKKWDEKRKEQADLFMGYFESEQTVLKAYGDLIRFYAEKKDVLKIADDAVTFEAPEDQTKHDELKAALKQAQAQQAKFLKPQPSAPAQKEAAPPAAEAPAAAQ